MTVMSEDDLKGAVHLMFFNIGDIFLEKETLNEVILSFMVEVTGKSEG